MWLRWSRIWLGFNLFAAFINSISAVNAAKDGMMGYTVFYAGLTMISVWVCFDIAYKGRVK